MLKFSLHAKGDKFDLSQARNELARAITAVVIQSEDVFKGQIVPVSRIAGTPSAQEDSSS
jgi:hypothetical protein